MHAYYIQRERYAFFVWLSSYFVEMIFYLSDLQQKNCPFVFFFSNFNIYFEILMSNFILYLTLYRIFNFI